MAHLNYILCLFFFAMGSCVGSFLNVVVWRLPRVEPEEGESPLRAFYRSVKALSHPPSHCPKCQKPLKWYDNIPVLGWIKLAGKCRFCKEPISMRYPIVEAITGLIFAGYYWAYFVAHVAPCDAMRHPMDISADGWVYGLHMVLLSGLLAASLIDAELFIIPQEIPWVIIPIAVVAHAVFDKPGWAGSVAVSPLPAALAAGAGIGTIISITLLALKILPASKTEGAPMTEEERAEYKRQLAEEKQRERQKEKQDKKRNKQSKNSSGPAREPSPPSADEDAFRELTPGEVRREIGKEMLFLLLPMALGMACVLLAWKVQPVGQWWERIAGQRWVSAMLGSVLGGLIGGFVVWLTRILGSLGFGREAMGMGDVDLMAAVGAVLGGGMATTAFFLAPFFGILMALYMLATRKTRELPYGPYLSMATAFVMLFYCPIAAYFTPGLKTIGEMLSQMMGAGGA